MIRLGAATFLAVLLTATIFGFAASLNLNAAHLTVYSNTLLETSISTKLSGGTQTAAASITVPAGTAVTDHATLAGATSDAGGSVTYTVYSDNTCVTVHSDAGTKVVSNGSVPASDPITITLAGTYYWRASYSGDGNNQPYKSPCTDELLSVVAAQPAKLSFSSQPSSTTMAGTAFVAQPRVTILDAYDNIVIANSSAVVHMEVTNTGTTGAVLTCSPTGNNQTATGGLATFVGCSINKVGTGFTLTATSPGLTPAVSNPLSITVGTASKLVFGQQPTSTTAGTAISPAVTVRIEDNFGNLVTTATNQVGLAIGNNPASSTLSGGSPSSAVGGIATFSNVSLNKAGLAYTLIASSSGFSNQASSAFDISAGQPAKLSFSAQPSPSTPAGSAFASQPRVTILDANDNIVIANSSAVVHLELTNVGTTGAVVTCSPNTNNQTATGGLASFTGCSVNKVGTGFMLVATSPGLTQATSLPFNITVGTASRLVFSQQPTNTNAGSTMTPAVTVRIEDSSGNLVTTATNQVSLAIGSNPGGGVLSGGSAVSAVGGIATFSALSISAGGTGYTLVASSSGFTNQASNTFNITGVVPPPLPSCADANVYIMLDRTGGNASYLAAERAAAINLVVKFEGLVQQPKVAIGAVGGTNGASAATEHTLTNSYGDNDGAQDGDIYGAIEKAMASTSSVGSDLKAAFDTARLHLATATSGPKIMLFLSDGDPSKPFTVAADNQEAAYDASDAAKLAGVTVVSVHFGTDPTGFAGKELMAAVATGTVAAPASHAGHGHQPGASSDATNENGDGDNFYVTLDAIGLQSVYNGLCEGGEVDPSGSIQVTLDATTSTSNTPNQAIAFTSTIASGSCISDLTPNIFTLNESNTSLKSETCTGVTPIASGGAPYAVTATLPAGWLVVGISCTGDSGVRYGADSHAAFTVGDVSAQIRLDANENVVCTFQMRNDRAIVKVIEDDTTNSGTQFAFTDSLTGCDIGTLPDSGTSANYRLCFVTAANDLVVQQTTPLPTGWKLAAVACSGTATGIEFGTNGSTYTSAWASGKNTARFDLAAGAQVTCTFTNSPITAPATHDLYLSIPGSQLVTSVPTAGSTTLNPNGGSSLWASAATVTVSTTGSWSLSLTQTGPSNFESATLKVDVWLASGACGTAPATNATNYVAGNAGAAIANATLPRSVAVTLTGNVSFVAPGAARTLCVLVTDTESNNGSSHQFTISTGAGSYLRGPF